MSETNGRANGVNDHFLRKYRELLDAEDSAFDELEHAYEDGDRAHFEQDYVAWMDVMARRMAFLDRHGMATAPLAV